MLDGATKAPGSIEPKNSLENPNLKCIAYPSIIPKRCRPLILYFHLTLPIIQSRVGIHSLEKYNEVVKVGPYLAANTLTHTTSPFVNSLHLHSANTLILTNLRSLHSHATPTHTCLHISVHFIHRVFFDFLPLGQVTCEVWLKSSGGPSMKETWRNNEEETDDDEDCGALERLGGRRVSRA